MTYLVDVLYIFAFALFIYGLMGLTGPKTAVRGNWIAATGMAIAVIATLIRIRDTASINWILIVAVFALCAIGLGLGLLGLNAILVGTILIALAASAVLSAAMRSSST